MSKKNSGGRDRDDRDGGRGGGPPPDITKMVSLKVDGLSHRTSIDDLESLFEKYGRIGDVYIPKDYRTKESRGFGFVRFYSKYELDIPYLSQETEEKLQNCAGKRFCWQLLTSYHQLNMLNSQLRGNIQC